MSSAPPNAPVDPPLGLWRRLHLWGVQNPKWWYIAPPSTCAVAIYVLSLLPPEGFGRVARFTFPGADKLGHAIAYMTLAVLTIRGWHREKIPPIGLHGFVWLLTFVFGTWIEIHQALDGLRQFELRDILANNVGAVSGLVLWHMAMVRWGRRTRQYPGLFRPKLDSPPPSRRS